MLVGIFALDTFREDTKNIDCTERFCINFDYKRNVFMHLDAKNETSAIKIGVEKRMEFLHKELLRKDIKDSHKVT